MVTRLEPVVCPASPWELRGSATPAVVVASRPADNLSSPCREVDNQVVAAGDRNPVAGADGDSRVAVAVAAVAVVEIRKRSPSTRVLTQGRGRSHEDACKDPSNERYQWPAPRPALPGCPVDPRFAGYSNLELETGERLHSGWKRSGVNNSTPAASRRAGGRDPAAPADDRSTAVVGAEDGVAVRCCNPSTRPLTSA